MKKALIIGSNSSHSKFENGMVIRQTTIKKFLIEEGFEVEIFQPDFDLKSKSFNLVVTLSVRKVSLAFKLCTKNSGVWIDFCDSWLYQRFAWTTGLRLKLVGFIESFVLLRNRTKLRDCLVTYISPLDLNLDRALHTILDISETKVMMNSYTSIIVKHNPLDPKRLVFVGNGRYFPNLLAILELSLIIGPRISSKNHDWNVNVYGAGWPSWVKLLPNISLHGYTAENDIYSISDIHLAPMRQRAGIKNKILIPLAAGIPVVAYGACINGIENSNNLYVATTTSEYAKILLGLLESSGLSNSEPYNKNQSYTVSQDILNWTRRIAE